MGELRALWAATGMTINRFAAVHPIDKGTVSRYLRGERVPREHWFLDRLLEIQAEKGKEVSQQVREHLIWLQLEALRVAHPGEYRVRRVSDELEVAVVAQREAERHAHALEQQLTDRLHRIDDLTRQLELLRAAWDADRIVQQADKEQLEQQIAGLEREVAELARYLQYARQRSADAEHRCQKLEELLNHLDAPHNNDPDDLQNISFADPDSVVRLLESMQRVGAEDQARALAERAATETEATDPDCVIRLLDVMQRVGAEDQARALAERAATETEATDPDCVIRLLDVMQRVGAEDQARALAERAATEIEATDPYMASLLRSMERAGAEDQAQMPAGLVATTEATEFIAAVEKVVALASLAVADEHVTTAMRRLEWVMDEYRTWPKISRG